MNRTPIIMLVLLTGCGVAMPVAPTDAGYPGDTQEITDGPHVDGGYIPVDSGSVGPLPDGGSTGEDAAPPTVDAGPSDSGFDPGDAGTPAPDAGAVDAATPTPDAGAPVDAGADSGSDAGTDVGPPPARVSTVIEVSTGRCLLDDLHHMWCIRGVMGAIVPVVYVGQADHIRGSCAIRGGMAYCLNETTLILVPMGVAGTELSQDASANGGCAFTTGASRVLCWSLSPWPVTTLTTAMGVVDDVWIDDTGATAVGQVMLTLSAAFGGPDEEIREFSLSTTGTVSLDTPRRSGGPSSGRAVAFAPRGWPANGFCWTTGTTAYCRDVRASHHRSVPGLRCSRRPPSGTARSARLIAGPVAEASPASMAPTPCMHRSDAKPAPRKGRAGFLLPDSEGGRPQHPKGRAKGRPPPPRVRKRGPDPRTKEERSVRGVRCSPGIGGSGRTLSRPPHRLQREQQCQERPGGCSAPSRDPCRWPLASPTVP
jgi:hypothetical protein